MQLTHKRLLGTVLSKCADQVLAGNNDAHKKSVLRISQDFERLNVHRPGSVTSSAPNTLASYRIPFT